MGGVLKEKYFAEIELRNVMSMFQKDWQHKLLFV